MRDGSSQCRSSGTLCADCAGGHEVVEEAQKIAQDGGQLEEECLMKCWRGF